MNKIIILIYWGIFFLGTNVLNSFGINTYRYFYFIVACASTIVLLKKLYKGRRYEIYIIISILLLLVYRHYTGILDDSLRSAMILFTTPVIFLMIPKDEISLRQIKLKRSILKVLFIFFVVECLIALIEFVFKIHIFLWIDNVFESHTLDLNKVRSFRSIALHGSPLGNALIVLILNTFILMSSLKDKYKLFFWILGFLAVLSFNARMAILLHIIIYIVYLFKVLNNRTEHNPFKFILILFTGIFFTFGSYIIFFTGLGNRLVKMGFLDESSAQVRLNLFDIFSYYSLSDFWFGKSMATVESITEMANILIIENFWIAEILLFGLLFVIIMVILYYKLLKQYFNSYSLGNRICIILIFLTGASINNSLYTQYIPLLLFLVCSNIFRPQTLKKLLPTKYLNL